MKKRYLWLAICISSAQAFVDPAADPVACSEAGSLIYPYRAFTQATTTTSTPLPLILFLHGLGEKGTDNEKQVRSHLSGLITKTQGNSTTPAEYPAILVAPQAPNGWFNGHSLHQLTQMLSTKYPVDRERIYVTGLSAGGKGTWDTLSHSPELYAAGVPLSGVQFTPGIDWLAEARIPIWAFHGLSDTTVGPSQSTNMVNGIIAAGGLPPRYTKRENWGHSSWNQIYSESPGWTNYYDGSDPSDTDERLYRWLFSQKNTAPETFRPGEKILIDFGSNHRLTRRSQSTLRWNNALLSIQGSSANEAPALPSHLITQAGKRISTAFTISATFDGTENNAASGDSLYHENAQVDGWFSGGFQGGHAGALANPAAIKFTGLIPTGSYSLKCYGANNGNDNGRGFLTRYQVGTQWRDLEASENTSETVEFSQVTANALGELELQIGVSPAGTARFAFLNVLELTALSAPENTFADWVVSQLPAEFPTQFNSDEDHDGLPLLVEYALGSHPIEHSDRPLSIDADGAVSGCFSASAQDGTVILEGSNLEGNWLELASYDFSTNSSTHFEIEPTGDGKTNFRYPAERPDLEAFSFYRLKVSLP